MNNNIKITMRMGMAAVLLWLGCAKHVTTPTNGKALFRINVQYGKSVEPGDFAKPADAEAINNVRILVMDLSKYQTWEQFIASSESQTINSIKNSTFQKTKTWAEWEGFYRNYLTVVSNQNLEIKTGYATGTVTGVVGLNWIVLGFLDGDVIWYSGEAHPVGGEGAHAHSVYVPVEAWSGGNSLIVESNPPGASVYLAGTTMNVCTP